MTVSGGFRVSAALGPYHIMPFHTSSPSTKVDVCNFLNGGSRYCETSFKWPCIATGKHNKHELAPKSISREAESFLLDAISMSFSERLNLAWKIIFPSKASQRNSNARIAKQRLKMILFSDRCEVSEEAKRMIVNNVVHALSDFVVIESQDKVQLNVSTDSALGTIYSVTVPVRRVKPEYQEVDEAGTITNIEYKDTGEKSGSVDVRFDFYIPDEMSQ